MPFEPLACSDVKGNAGPTPVIDIHFDGRVRFRHRGGANVRLLAIAGYVLIGDLPGSILSPHGSLCHVLHSHGPNGSKQLNFLLTHRVRVASDRRSGEHTSEL